MNVPSTIKDVHATTSAMRRGEMTMVEAQRIFNAILESPEALKENIASYTLPELKKMVYVGSGEKKDYVARKVFDSLIQRFSIASFGYDPMAEKYNDALKRNVNAQTQAQLDAFVAENAAEREALDRSLTDPQTLSEFMTFVNKKGVKALSDEQLARYDKLNAEAYMRQQATRKDERNTVAAVKVDTDMEMVKTVHTKKGTDIWVVKLGAYVAKDAYYALNSAAKRLGGYHSSFRGPGAVPGFQFQTQQNAEQFMALQQGDVKREDTTPSKLAKVGDRFREMAERLDDKGDDILTSDRKTNTYRRARMAESAENKAVAMKKQAKVLNQLADAMDEGKLLLLQNIRTASDVQSLQSILARAFYKRMRELQINDRSPQFVRDIDKDVRYIAMPQPSLWVSHIPSWQADMEKRAGYKKTAKWLGTIVATAKRNKMDQVWVSPADMDHARNLNEYLKETRSYTFLDDEIKEYDRMARMGLTTFSLLRAALREFYGVTHGTQALDTDAQYELEIRQAEREFVGKKYAGFFPTPKELTETIVDEADIQNGMRVLEPSAGIGHIADVIKKDYPGAQLDVVEYNSDMRQFLEKKGHNVVGSDIFDLTEAIYDRVVMNPPFEDLADIDHVRHAFTLLKPGGRLVAIMAANKQGDRTKVREFRDFVDQHGTMEPNEPGAFKSAFRPTGVNTITVVLDKPEQKLTAPQGPDPMALAIAMAEADRDRIMILKRKA
jgi:phospholipid N-methyltransferase